MKPEARRTYRGFSTFFLVTGILFLGLAVLRFTAFPGFLRGDPTWVAGLLIVIGGMLRWTVRDRGDDEREDPPRLEDGGGASGDTPEDAGEAGGREP